MTYCDTYGHQFSDVCGGCETLEGVPVKTLVVPANTLMTCLLLMANKPEFQWKMWMSTSKIF